MGSLLSDSAGGAVRWPLGSRLASLSQYHCVSVVRIDNTQHVQEKRKKSPENPKKKSKTHNGIKKRPSKSSTSRIWH